jgi:integrase
MIKSAPPELLFDPLPSSAQSRPNVWTLTIIAKRRKQRTLPVSRATIDALRGHWRDRGRNFDAAAASGPVTTPTRIAGTRAARERHDARSKEAGKSDRADRADRATEMPDTVDAFG